MSFDYDLFVIGAGSGGVRAARMSAQYGAKVAIAEDTYLGGTCVNVGCVPKKLFVYASEFSDHFSDSQGFGWQFNHKPKFNWQQLVDNKNKEIQRLNKIYQNLLDTSGADVYLGKAVIDNPQQVSINGSHYSCKHILIATGGWPYIPEFPGSQHAVTSNEMFFLDSLPESIIIVGGGYVAVEFACILHGLGVKTHLVYRGSLFLRGFDLDLREQLKRAMEQKGIQLHFDQNVGVITKQGNGTFLAKLDSNNQLEYLELEADLVMYATGRKPRVNGLGLENTKVVLKENNAIETNEFFQTAESSIYALGDVIDKVPLTPVAIHEAMHLASNLFNSDAKDKQTMDYENIATAVFCQPTIGTVGLTEEQAKQKYNQVSVFKSEFKALKTTLSGSTEKTFMKLIVDQQSQKVVGCHMLGEHAGEIIQGIAIAIKAGATKQQFDATVGIHPTSAEEFVTMRNPE